MLCLTRPTDPRWVEVALGDLEAVLVDHAHCEMKAASNALSLAARSPGFPRIARALVTLAEEEITHLGEVMDELDRRGLELGKPEPDAYAAGLRKLASDSHKGRTARESLVDRLLVGALIEARSCERFRLLSDALEARGDAELAAFYQRLFTEEARHYRTFIDLASQVAGDEAVARARLSELAEAEGRLADGLGERAAIHG